MLTGSWGFKKNGFWASGLIHLTTLKRIKRARLFLYSIREATESIQSQKPISLRNHNN
jgi:hypothetical protein